MNLLLLGKEGDDWRVVERNRMLQENSVVLFEFQKLIPVSRRFFIISLHLRDCHYRGRDASPTGFMVEM